MALFRSGPATRDLRGFLNLLESRGQLKRISAAVDPDLELAAIADRVLAQGGPALLFENVIGSSMPVAVNTLGTVERVVWSMGLERAEQLEELGSRLTLQQPDHPGTQGNQAVRSGLLGPDQSQARPGSHPTLPAADLPRRSGRSQQHPIRPGPAMLVE